MDLWAFVTSTVGMFVIGLFFVGLWRGWWLKSTTKEQKKLSSWIGVPLVCIALLSYAGINVFVTEEAAPAGTVGAFEVTATESLTQLTVDNNANLITWAVDIGNYSTPAFVSNCQYFSVAFTVDRGLGTVGLVQTYGDVTSIPSITNDTTAVSTPILSKTGDQYNAIWTRADATTAYDMITITIAEDADGATVTLNMTLTLTAIESMHQYDSVNIGLMVGGEVWTVQVLDTT